MSSEGYSHRVKQAAVASMLSCCRLTLHTTTGPQENLFLLLTLASFMNKHQLCVAIGGTTQASETQWQVNLIFKIYSLSGSLKASGSDALISSYSWIHSWDDGSETFSGFMGPFKTRLQFQFRSVWDLNQDDPEGSWNDGWTKDSRVTGTTSSRNKRILFI